MAAPSSIRKCVIPTAGLGTRFLPATKAVPKEMLPIVDAPTLQYIIEEAVAAGIPDVILVNGRGKVCIEDHFDVAFELETVSAARGKEQDLNLLQSISRMANIVSIRQKRPLGLGHAVLCSQIVVGNAPFAVMLGDDVIDAEEPAIGQLAAAYQKYGKGIIALMEVPDDSTHLYGIAVGKKVDDRTYQLTGLVEKPKAGTAPSNLAVIGRYVLPPSIYGHLERQTPGVGGEIQLTDALAQLKSSEGLMGYIFKGERYDAGERVGYLKANLDFAMKRPELSGPLLEWIRQRVPHWEKR